MSERYLASFKLAAGGIDSHEGHRIVTLAGTEKEIHLIARHGEQVDKTAMLVWNASKSFLERIANER